MAERVESFSEMLRSALGAKLDAGSSGFLDMLADNAAMEFPYAPPGLPHRVEGRAAIGEYLAGVGRLLAFDRVRPATVHGAADADVTVLEFEGEGRGVATGAPYRQRYVSVVHTAGGRITLYRDYWNPLAILAAVKDPPPTGAVTVEGFRLG